MKFFVTVFLFGLFLSKTFAQTTMDSVIMKSGDVIVGKIEKSDDNVIVMDAFPSGKSVQIKKTYVERINSFTVNNYLRAPLSQSPGTALTEAGQLFIGAGALTVLGATLSGVSVAIDNSSAQKALLYTGVGLSGVSFFLYIAAGSKLISAGNLFNEKKIGTSTSLKFDYYGTSASIKFKF